MRHHNAVGLVGSLVMAAACNSSDAMLGRGGDSGMGDDGNASGVEAGGEVGSGGDTAGSDTGLPGPAACVAAGGRCVIGPPTNCPTIIGPQDCNPPPVNPGGAICCLPNGDASQDATAVTDAATNGDANGGATMQSCQPGGDGLSNCGPNSESCCVSPVVPGGTFFRSYDGVTFTDMGNPATVSSFRLDKYEITVGRFRQFVGAVIGGWLPASGSGKHTHLNHGQGLSDSSSTQGTFETGWNSSWNNNLSTTASGWNANLNCTGDGIVPTWTASLGSNEVQPINCVNWYQAYAFCSWDGGFLPSEAEWNYAASGGSEQRYYPWSIPPSSQAIDCTYANYTPLNYTDSGGAPLSYRAPCVVSQNPNADPAVANNVGSESPKGDGKWGHTDLAGNVSEWTLDWFVPYAVPCADCAYVGTASEPVSTTVDRGGSFDSLASGFSQVNPGWGPVLASNRNSVAPTMNITTLGARCARTP
jgi:sulfatase modifying factor 1